jgi:hypothetical protein
MFKAKKEIKIASDNTIKNSLINFDVDFSGLKEAVALFFPSIRNEMILRYRAETIAKIGIEAYRIVKSNDIQINPIPPKIALPLIDKMSIEHEPDMYERWAKLLIATGVKPNPIYQQYADILANMNARSANFLMDIYLQQSKMNVLNDIIEERYDEYMDKFRFNKYFDEINRILTMKNFSKTEKTELLPKSSGVSAYFQFPYIFHGTEKSKTSNKQKIIFYGDGNTESDRTYLIFTNEDNSMLIGLEKLGIIRYQWFYSEEKKDEDGKPIYVERCGVFLTLFGYSFVDCLEHPTK